MKKSPIQYRDDSIGKSVSVMKSVGVHMCCCCYLLTFHYYRYREATKLCFERFHFRVPFCSVMGFVLWHLIIMNQCIVMYTQIVHTSGSARERMLFYGKWGIYWLCKMLSAYKSNIICCHNVCIMVQHYSRAHESKRKPNKNPIEWWEYLFAHLMQLQPFYSSRIHKALEQYLPIPLLSHCNISLQKLNWAHRKMRFRIAR